MAMRLSSGIDCNQGVAVAADVKRLERQLERAPAVAFGHYPRVGCEYRPQCGRQLSSEGAGLTVWGVNEHEIVLTSVVACGLEPSQRGLADHLGLDSQRLQ